MMISAIVRLMLIDVLLLLSNGVGSGERQAVRTALPDVDSMSYLENDYIKVGVDLSLGGAISYLATAFSKENMINNFDWGRQIQLSFYGGPTPFTPGGKQPHPQWRMLGWNLIQSGDWAGNRSRMVSHSNNGREIYIKCIPMQWPLNNEPGECFFESWIRLEENVVRVRAKLTNNRQDTTFYYSRSQEMPAVYTNIKYGKLITYQGMRPFTNDTITAIERDNLPGEDPIQWKYWQATESWAACIDEKGRGLGVWSPETQSFCGGRYGRRQDTVGTKAQATAYLSPLSAELLDHNIEFEYRYDLIAGTVQEIRDFVYRQKKGQKTTLPDYYFKSDRQHVALYGLRDGGWPVKEGLDLQPVDQGFLLTPASVWRAEEAPVLELEAAYTGTAGEGRVAFRRFGQQALDSLQIETFRIIPDGRMRKYRIPLSANARYTGSITRLQFMPFPAANPLANPHCKIKRIRLLRKAP